MPSNRERSGTGQGVHAKTIERIHELVLVQGITDPLEMQRHLKYYVHHSLCNE